jgi:hypothetical protein
LIFLLLAYFLITVNMKMRSRSIVGRRGGRGVEIELEGCLRHLLLELVDMAEADFSPLRLQDFDEFNVSLLSLLEVAQGFSQTLDLI